MRSMRSSLKGWKTAGTGLAVLIVVQAFGAGAGRSQEPAQPRIDEEIAKQEKIYGTRGADVPRGYVTGRTLSTWSFFPPASATRSALWAARTDGWISGRARDRPYWTTPHPNTVRHRVKYARGPTARCVRSRCPSKTAGRTHGNGRPPASARIVYDISPASACGTTRPRNLENSGSSPTCTAASPIP